MGIHRWFEQRRGGGRDSHASGAWARGAREEAAAAPKLPAAGSPPPPPGPLPPPQPWEPQRRLPGSQPPAPRLRAQRIVRMAQDRWIMRMVQDQAVFHPVVQLLRVGTNWTTPNSIHCVAL
ncbi:uncharacterized protein PS065_003149 [Dugong dugon]